MNNLTKLNNKLILFLALAFALFIFSACTSSSSDSSDSEEMGEMEEMDHDSEDMEEMDHDMEEMDHDDEMEHNHDDGVSRIPNQDGATISIVGPEDGSSYAFGDQIIVEVAVENFELGEDGSHWHIYIDGSSWGMVMGKNTEQALTGIEPGMHEISAFLAIGTHEEFENGDSIMITVEE